MEETLLQVPKWRLKLNSAIVILTSTKVVWSLMWIFAMREPNRLSVLSLPHDQMAPWWASYHHMTVLDLRSYYLIHPVEVYPLCLHSLRHQPRLWVPLDSWFPSCSPNWHEWSTSKKELAHMLSLCTSQSSSEEAEPVGYTVLVWWFISVTNVLKWKLPEAKHWILIFSQYISKWLCCCLW